MNWATLTDWTESGILRFSTIDASRISTILKGLDAKFQRIYRAVGLLADTIHPVSTIELIMTLYSEEQMPAVLAQKPGHFGTSIFGSLENDEEIVYPVYQTIPDLPDELSEALDLFESKGYLLKWNDGYVFKHPVYQHASLWDLKGIPTFQAGKFFKDLNRAVAVLDINNALTATRTLSTIFYNRMDLRNKLISLADGLRLSIFPAVQDAAFTFLLKNIDHADEELASELRRDIANYDPDTGSIFWHDGIPVFTDKTINRFNRYKARHSVSELSVIEGIIKRIDEKKEPVTPKEAWDVIQYALGKHSKLKLDSDNIVELLKFNEGFIRAKVAFYYMSSLTDPEPPVMARLFDDVHPNVVFEAYKGAFKGWPLYNAQTRNTILPLLKNALMKEHIVLRSRDLMTQYTAGYTSFTFDWYQIEKKYHKDMWVLWGMLLPDFLANFRSDSHFNKSRFVATIRDSKEFLSADQTYTILTAWLNWLNKYLQLHSAADTDRYYLTSHFLEIAKDLGSERDVLSKQLIEHGSFHFAAYNMRVFLENWEDLTDTERSCIEILLAKSENFGLRAVALTARRVPSTVQAIISGDALLLQNSPEIIIGLLGNDVVDACLNLDFGSEAYSYLTYGHSTVWESVLISTLDNPDLPFAKYVGKQAVEDNFFSEETFARRWQTPTIFFTKLLRTQNSTLIEKIRYVMLNDLTSNMESTSVELWRAFLENLNVDERQKTVDQVFDCFPAIEMRDNLKIPHTVFENSEWNRAFDLRYKDDDTLYNTLKNIKEMDERWIPEEPSRSSMFLFIIKSFIEAGNIYMLTTIEYCEDIIDQMKPELAELTNGVPILKKRFLPMLMRLE